MATFVLVHGGGHGGWCYQKVKRLLEPAGHEVFAPSLTGLAERSHLLSPDVDLDMHINDVVQLLHYWDLARRRARRPQLRRHGDHRRRRPLADRIGKLVYLDSANPTNGQSLVEVSADLRNGPHDGHDRRRR